jgi:glycosyltransferase involved in cell wall biosynthesis
MENGISIIIPTYNRQKFVKEAIQSVLDQNYEGKLEIIISDDGSTDETLAIVESFGNKIKLLRKPESCTTQGVASTRNRGIKAATQPFICFLDSDDFYLPGHLKKMAIELKNKPELGFAFCRILEVKEEDGKNLFRRWTHQKIYKHDIANPVVSRIRVVHTNSFIFRKEVFDKVGYFNESYSNGEDGDLWMRISEQYKGTFSDHYGAVYRTKHSINQLTRNCKNQLQNCYLDIHENAIQRYYKMGLKNTDRIFKLKYWCLVCKYRDNKLIFYSKYLNLILNHPVPFLREATVFYQEFKEKRKTNVWDNLNKFL